MYHSLSRFVSILFILGMLLAGMPVEEAHAAGILVNTAADEDVDNANCSLREAITAANSDAAYNGCSAGSGTDTITFAGDYTITLSAVYGQLPPVTSVITINGNGPDHTIIEASSCNPITMPYGCTPATYRVFSSTGGNLTLDGMTVRHGQCAGSCTTSGSNGGGLLNQGSILTVSDVSLVGNTADRGGALYTVNGISTLTGATLSGNVANYGGAIHDQADFWDSYLHISNTTFHGNNAWAAGGAIYAGGLGGTYYDPPLGASTSTLDQVTFSGNTAANGGAINGSGAGLWGRVNFGLAGVILWDDSATSADPEFGLGSQATANISYSVIEGGCASIISATCGAGNLDADPLLAPLQDNGGPTPTMALLAGSSAIDAGDDSACASAPVNGLDQRGVTRPRGPHCDIGAYERIPPVSDFDYDDMTDPAKFVPGTGMAWWLKSSTGLWDSAAMGSDVSSYVSRSDFNGDARTDPGKYVAAGQALYYRLSPSYAAWDGDYMGTGTYTLMPGSDFDGDQMTDPAKYMTDGSYWRLPSSTAVWVGDFIGTDAAPALPGSDYDGDGKTDVAKYVAAGAIWYLGSSDSTWHGEYLGSDGTPVPASDFDGDGITDMAKYLTGSNVLWWLGSNSGLWTGVYLGPGASIPVPAADFDGDGKTDPARFDTGGKVLWWLRSSDGGLDGAYMGPETYEVVN